MECIGFLVCVIIKLEIKVGFDKIESIMVCCFFLKWNFYIGV